LGGAVRRPFFVQRTAQFSQRSLLRSILILSRRIIFLLQRNADAA